jgi:hypothetical protein
MDDENTTILFYLLIKAEADAILLYADRQGPLYEKRMPNGLIHSHSEANALQLEDQLS